MPAIGASKPSGRRLLHYHRRYDRVNLRLPHTVRERVVAATTDLFSRVPFPLSDTLSYAPDPGLFGPDSITWPVMADTATFVGGLRALLIQTAHPEVVAGVADHSRYEADPLGRLSRTSAYVTATSFGATPEVERAIDVVRRAHLEVRGTSHRERPYTADEPGLGAWVHNALTDSFLTTNQTYGKRTLSTDEADRFVAEQVRLGALHDSNPLPRTAQELRAWMEHHPDLAPSPGMIDAVRFLRSPPLPWHIRAPYRILFEAAVATVPQRLRSILGVRVTPGAIRAGSGAVSGLRWALGYSPAWHLALVRVGAPIPDGMFTRTFVENEG